MQNSVSVFVYDKVNIINIVVYNKVNIIDIIINIVVYHTVLIDIINITLITNIIIIIIIIVNLLHQRYTEKSPGRIVGDSQCEKLPVEVRADPYILIYIGCSSFAFF